MKRGIRNNTPTLPALLLLCMLTTGCRQESPSAFRTEQLTIDPGLENFNRHPFEDTTGEYGHSFYNSTVTIKGIKFSTDKTAHYDFEDTLGSCFCFLKNDTLIVSQGYKGSGYATLYTEIHNGRFRTGYSGGTCLYNPEHNEYFVPGSRISLNRDTFEMGDSLIGRIEAEYKGEFEEWTANGKFKCVVKKWPEQNTEY